MSSKDFDHLVIHTGEGWRQGHSTSVSVDEAGRLLLSSEEDISLPKNALSRPLGCRLDETGSHLIITHDDSRLETLKNPLWIGIAFDRRNNLYLIDGKTCRMFRYCGKSETLEQVMYIGGCGSQVGRFSFVSPKDGKYCGRMAFGKSSVYFADTYNHRVQAFYLPSFQLRYILGGMHEPIESAFKSPSAELWKPTDICVNQMGTVYVLDSGNARVLMLGRFGTLVKIIGTSKEGGSVLQEPICIALDVDECLYVLDAKKQTIVKFDKFGDWCEEIVFFHPTGPRIQPVTMAVGRDKILYVAGESPTSNSRIHQFDGNTGSYLGHFTIEGDCSQLKTDRNGRLYGICGCGSRIVRFGGQGHFASQGTYFSKVLVSTREKCQWHRLLLEAEIPEKTRVQVDFYASDQPFDPKTIDAAGWRSVLMSPQGSVVTRDALFNEATGQYLALKFVLFGDGGRSPAIKKAQVFFQRNSFLRYLPATFQEDARGRDFLERFLSIFESMSSEIENKIAHATRYIDVDATETTFLDWLGSWLAVIGDENWSIEKRRVFLKEAFELYKYRGTWKGLRRTIELFTGGKAGIVEHFRLRPPMVLGQASIVGVNTFVVAKPTKGLILGASSTIGEFVLTDAEEPPEQPFEIDANDFTVFAATSHLKEPQRSALQRLIEQETPAHTRCFLRTSREIESQLGICSLLDVDTVLTNGYRPMRLGESSTIGKKAFLGKKYWRKGIVGIRSRIAVDAILH